MYIFCAKIKPDYKELALYFLDILIKDLSFEED
ncbi:hypothetical protein AB210_0426 [Acinetobacter baumannii AB210]|nr:hypothetical protein A1S_3567 [Acinetobacter baumannii ATCC 17978]EGK48946.1 hypothetical protein AB210_0426 [Acinetobacter baumannii AB210]